MPFNPFNNDSEDASFEQGSPVTQAAKTVAKAAVALTDDQIKAANDAFISQLGIAAPSAQEPGTDEANPQVTDQSNTIPHTAGVKSGTPTGTNQTQQQPTDDQTKIEKLRHELFGNYSAQYKSAPNNVGNITTNLEQEIEKARQERKKRDQEREQQLEEEEHQREEAKKSQEQENVSPAGKKTGAQFGKKQQPPIALRQAKTKTEINRGTSG